MSVEISIAEYDHTWPTRFDHVSHHLNTALSGLDYRIEHVGSTAVPGLAAKPIIDLDVVIGDWTEFATLRAALEEIGYEHEGDLGIAEREAFRAPSGSPAHHLYVCVQSSPELARHIAFRDRLRRRPDVARAYAHLKRDIARTFWGNPTAYTHAKSQFIEEQLLRESRRNDSAASRG